MRRCEVAGRTDAAWSRPPTSRAVDFEDRGGSRPGRSGDRRIVRSKWRRNRTGARGGSPAAPPIASSTSTMAGTMAMAASVRSLRQSARRRQSRIGGGRLLPAAGITELRIRPAPAARRRNTSAVGSGISGLTSRMCEIGHRRQPGSIRSPMPPTKLGPAGEADRQIGAELKRRAPPSRPAEISAAPRAAISASSAAAASAEPPPMPEATGRFLVRRSRAPCFTRRLQPAAGAPRGARDCRRRRKDRRRRARRSQATDRRRRFDRQLVAVGGEGHQAVEQMEPVGAPADEVQKQIDLRRRAAGG